MRRTYYANSDKDEHGSVADEKIATLMNSIFLHPTPATMSLSCCADEQPAQLFDTINMKAEICWENAEKSVIRYTFSGIWNWDDFYHILEQRDFLPLEHDVTVIVDFRAISLPPSDAILHLKRAAKMAEARSSLIILISNSATIATLFQAFVTMYKTVGKRLRIVNNDEEAYAVLRKL